MNIIGLGGINKRIDDENFDSLEDAIANREFGMDYKQLGKNEKEWVRDEMDIIGLGGVNNGSVKRNKIGQFYIQTGIFERKYKRGGMQKLQAILGANLFFQRGKKWFYNSSNIKKLTIKQLDSLIKKMK